MGLLKFNPPKLFFHRYQTVTYGPFVLYLLVGALLCSTLKALHLDTPDDFPFNF